MFRIVKNTKEHALNLRTLIAMRHIGCKYTTFFIRKFQFNFFYLIKMLYICCYKYVKSKI